MQAYSIDLSGADCTAAEYVDLVDNDLINEGRLEGPKWTSFGVFVGDGDGSRVFRNCRLARANQGLQLAACAMTILTMIVTFKLWRAHRLGPLPATR